MNPTEKPIILGLCTSNRCRSQMFEAILNHLGQGNVEAVSAGTKPTFVHSLAKKVLSEISINCENQFSKKIQTIDHDHDNLVLADSSGNQIELKLSRIKKVITLCGEADKSCPNFPEHIAKEHWPIDDPDQYKGSEEEILPFFRKSRDDIFTRIEQLIKLF